MSKGYVCVAQNNDSVDYVKLAYILALSIRNTQSEVNKLSIITDVTDIPEKYKEVFDHIIPIENDRAVDTTWKLHNIVDLYDYSPYDETVMLDSDMLFLTDVSHWWDVLSKRDIWFTTNTRTYLNEPAPTNTIYRQEFIINELPSVYNAFFYFKKCEIAKELFDTMKLICENWDYCVNTYLYKRKPNVFSTDVAFGLALKLTGLTSDSILPQISFPYFTHMKLHNQGWEIPSVDYDGDWTRCTDVSHDILNDNLGIKIGTVRQNGLLHYHVKDFVTDDMLEILENNNG